MSDRDRFLLSTLVGLLLVAVRPGAAQERKLSEIVPNQPPATVILEVVLEKLDPKGTRFEEVPWGSQLKPTDNIRLRTRSNRDGYLRLFWVSPQGVQEQVSPHTGALYAVRDNATHLPSQGGIHFDPPSASTERLRLEFSGRFDGSGVGRNKKLTQIRVRRPVDGSNLYLGEAEDLNDFLMTIDLTLRFQRETTSNPPKARQEERGDRAEPGIDRP